VASLQVSPLVSLVVSRLENQRVSLPVSPLASLRASPLVSPRASLPASPPVSLVASLQVSPLVSRLEIHLVSPLENLVVIRVDSLLVNRADALPAFRVPFRLVFLHVHQSHQARLDRVILTSRRLAPPRGRPTPPRPCRLRTSQRLTPMTFCLSLHLEAPTRSSTL
jgi:hypothetical protein